MKVKNSLIKLTKENIYYLYHEVITVDIDIKRLANRRYQSKIKLKTKTGSFFADKEDQGYRKSLEKSYDAIKKQLEKVKINKIHKHFSDLIFEEYVQEDQVA
jgi:ribosome-associated translation inhibitor RaiA